YKLSQTLVDHRDGSIYGAILEWDQSAGVLVDVRPSGAPSALLVLRGHSLGAGFALQVGKALAKQGIYVETHLFNPPSVSLAMSLKDISKRAGFAWKRIRAKLHHATKLKPVGMKAKILAVNWENGCLIYM
ncbi:hypothetical protein AG4045_014847, partial [Apium graveolens]